MKLRALSNSCSIYEPQARLAAAHFSAHNPDSANLQLKRGEQLLKEGRFADAQTLFTVAEETFSCLGDSAAELSRTALLSGAALISQMDYAGGLARLEKGLIAAASDPRLPLEITAATELYAQTLWEEGGPERAEAGIKRIFQQALEQVQSGNAALVPREILEQLIKVYLRNGKKALALETLNDAITAAAGKLPEYALFAAARFGSLLQRRREHAEARLWFEKALTLCPRTVNTSLPARYEALRGLTEYLVAEQNHKPARELVEAEIAGCSKSEAGLWLKMQLLELSASVALDAKDYGAVHECKARFDQLCHSPMSKEGHQLVLLMNRGVALAFSMQERHKDAYELQKRILFSGPLLGVPADSLVSVMGQMIISARALGDFEALLETSQNLFEVAAAFPRHADLMRRVALVLVKECHARGKTLLAVRQWETARRRDPELPPLETVYSEMAPQPDPVIASRLQRIRLSCLVSSGSGSIPAIDL